MNIPAVAILKHTHVCGIATRANLLNAWKSALAGDPVSAFGGVLSTNTEVDHETATEIDQLFYEVLIAPAFSESALLVLQKKKNRILIKLKHWPDEKWQFKSLLNGIIRQDRDAHVSKNANLKSVTSAQSTPSEIEDLIYALLNSQQFIFIQ